MDTETKLCNRCKSKLPNSNFDKKSNCEYLKRCKDCNNKSNTSAINNRCEHNREKRRCKECGGSGLCPHGKRKHRCKDCCKPGEGEFCIHMKRKSRCKECQGSEICPHKKRVDLCIICKPHMFCEHKRQKHICVECSGASVCEHNRRKVSCVECSGASICDHKKLRSTCRICDFSGYLSCIVRTAVWRGLKSDKKNHSIDYLGCSIEEYKVYLEDQFKEGMSWDNYGDLWHIDHKVPLRYDSPSEEDMFDRLHYSNTQPLLATENWSKGNRYIS